MKKIIIYYLLAFTIFISSVMSTNIEVKAQEDLSMDIPFEELLADNALIGYSEMSTRGYYLSSGMSTINDAGGGKIGWGGCTYAARYCKVSINAIVERYEGTSWVRVTSSTTTKENSVTAVVSKSTLVGSGYYYRVRCIHHAESDVCYSSTDALRM